MLSSGQLRHVKADPVAAEFPGGGEIVLGRFPRVRFLAEEKVGAVEVDVGQVQPHGAAHCSKLLSRSEECLRRTRHWKVVINVRAGIRFKRLPVA